MLRVGIDMDGVIADFRSAFLEVAGALPRELDDGPAATMSASEVELKRAWKEISLRRNWWTTLRPYEPEQIARVYELARRWKWEVIFLTKRPRTEGDSVQVQTQWWLEQHGYFMPSVLTVPGSRGEVANALHLDMVIDDQYLNCVEVISASPAKALLMLRGSQNRGERERALNRGIGVVSTMTEAVTVLERLHEIIPGRRGRLLRLTDWFQTRRGPEPELPLNVREARPLPEPGSPEGV